MLREVAMCQGATYTLILIVQHQGYITEVRRAFAPLFGCPPPCIEVACNPNLGSTGALTFSLHGWHETVQTCLVRHSQINCTKRYGPLCGPTSSSCAGPRPGPGPGPRLFFPFGQKKERFMLFWPIFGNFWCPVVTVVLFSSNLSSFERNPPKKNPIKIQKNSKNSKNPKIQKIQKIQKIF